MKPDDPRHGTNAGHKAHHAHGEPPCEPCKLAHAKARKRWLHARRNGQPAYVPALGTQRRIRALQALGWPIETIAAEAGWVHGNSVTSIFQFESIQRRTRDRIANVYERLSATPGPSSRTRILATRKGYAPPLAWDCIDTDEEPQGMRRAS